MIIAIVLGLLCEYDELGPVLDGRDATKKQFKGMKWQNNLGEKRIYHSLKSRNENNNNHLRMTRHYFVSRSRW